MQRTKSDWKTWILIHSCGNRWRACTHIVSTIENRASVRVVAQWNKQRIHSDMCTVRYWIIEYRLKCNAIVIDVCSERPWTPQLLTHCPCIHFSGTLEGLTHKPDYEKLLENPLMRFSGLYVEQCPPLMVRLQLFNNGEPFGLPVTTSYKSFSKRYK